eukprot:Nk52_evm87s270 gene=Nk52_evmTU87s270
MPQSMDIDSKLSMPLDSLVANAKKEKKKNAKSKANVAGKKAVGPGKASKVGKVGKVTSGGIQKKGQKTRVATKARAKLAAGKTSVKTSIAAKTAARTNARQAIVNRRRKLSASTVGPAFPSTSVSTLRIANLDTKVTQKDIKELFSIVGPLKYASLNCDHRGASKGSAEVVYQKSEDALKAVQQYNNRNLDGKPMKIDVVLEATKAVTKTLQQQTKAKTIQDRLGGFSGGAGPARGPGRNTKNSRQGRRGSNQGAKFTVRL